MYRHAHIDSTSACADSFFCGRVNFALSAFTLGITRGPFWGSVDSAFVFLSGVRWGAVGLLRYTLSRIFASLIDTAHTQAEIPSQPDERALVEPAVPAYLAHLELYDVRANPDLIPAALMTSLDRSQSDISRTIDRKRAERFWLSLPAAGQPRLPEGDPRKLAHNKSLQAPGVMSFLTALPSSS